MPANMCGFCNRGAEAKLKMPDGAVVKVCIVHLLTAPINWHAFAILLNGRWELQ